MRPHPTEKRCDKTKPKGKSPKGLRMRIVSAILRLFLRERERGITPPSPIQYSTPYNQCPSIPPSSPSLKKPSIIRSLTYTIVSMLSTMFSIPFIHNIPPNCATLPPQPEDSSTLSPPLSPYLQSYIRRATTTPSTPSIHYPYAYSLNTFLIVLFSYSLFIPPSCQVIPLQFIP